MDNVGIPGLQSSASMPRGLPAEAELLSGDAFLQMLAGLSAAGALVPPAVAAGDPALQEAGFLEGTDPFADDSPGGEAMLQSQVPALPLSPVSSGRHADLASTAMPLSAESGADELLALAMEADADTSSSGGNERGTASGTLSGAQALAASAGAAATFALSPERAAPASTAALQQQVHAPMHSPRWAEEVGQRVALMALNGAQSGSLSLVPEEMGPIEVRIHVSQDTASVWFGASQADTRAALQEALPRLREMFEASGLSLGEAQVSQQAPRREGEAPSVQRTGYVADAEAVPSDAQPLQRVGVGLVDTYA